MSISMIPRKNHGGTSVRCPGRFAGCKISIEMAHKQSNIRFINLFSIV